MRTHHRLLPRPIALQASIGNKSDIEHGVEGVRAAFDRIDISVSDTASNPYVTGQTVVIGGGTTVTIPGI